MFSRCLYCLSTKPPIWQHRVGFCLSLHLSLPGSPPPYCTCRSPFSPDTFHMIIPLYSSYKGFVHLLRLIQHLTCPNSTIPGKPNCSVMSSGHLPWLHRLELLSPPSPLRMLTSTGQVVCSLFGIPTCRPSHQNSSRWSDVWQERIHIFASLFFWEF